MLGIIITILYYYLIIVNNVILCWDDSHYSYHDDYGSRLFYVGIIVIIFSFYVWVTIIIERIIYVMT